ncbi:MAG: hypothetical protein IJS01_02330 [Lentisphaeria bacterium]|nr:hypothetical protein [Lentisphaeria bacterium]
MKFLLAVLCFSAAALPRGNEFRIDVVNRGSEKAAGFPVVVLLGPLGAAGDFDAVRITTSSGETFDGQFDDLNNNGKADKEDSVAFLADLQPGDNVFTLVFYKNGVPAPGPGADKAQEISVANETVKVSVHKQKPLLRRFFRRKDGQWQCAAAAFVLEPRMDNSWKWKNTAFRVSAVSEGKVRRVIRCEQIKTGTDNGKTVRIINDLSVFRGRNEILSSFVFVNDSPSQLVQINTVNTGMYQVLPEGNAAGAARFAGTLKGGKTVAGSITSGSFLLRRPDPGQEMWVNVTAGADPSCGFGVVPVDPAKVDNLLARYDAKNGNLRVSALFKPENAVLWPGKSAGFEMWMIPHDGRGDAVKTFAGNAGKIKVEYAK